MKYLRNQTNNTSAEILFYGIIGEGLSIDLTCLTKELDDLKKAGVCNLTFFVNCYGGDAAQGKAFWAYLNRVNFNVTWDVDGIAASMAAMLMTNPKHRVIANKYSKFMYHRIGGTVSGSIEDVRSGADMMEEFEADLIDMFATRTKLDKEVVKRDYFNNTDKWMSAEEAKGLGLVDELRDGVAAISEPPMNLTDPSDVYNHFATQITNYSNNNQTQKQMKKVALLLNLKEDANEDAFVEAVQNMLNSNKSNATELAKKDAKILELSNTVAEHQKSKIKNLVDGAITAKKFGEDMRETYTTMASTDYAMAEKVINNLAGVDPIIGQLENKGVPEAEKNMTWDDYHKKGTLENLKATNRARFEELYKAKTGKEYKD